MRLKILITVLVSIILINSCGVFRKSSKIKPIPADSSVEDVKPDLLQQSLYFMDLAKEAEQANDSLNAEYYYGKSIEFAGRFEEEFPEKNDSLSQGIISKINREYNRFLSKSTLSDQDSINMLNVADLLSSLEDSIDIYSSDSSFITIPDVIEENVDLRIPLILNKKVERAIEYFQGRGRRVFTIWLERSGWYEKLIKRILNEESVPEELFYLAMIESGFNPRARSYARAVGIWQFIYGTGRAYGLRSSWWYDERRDPEKSTRAAAKHLKDLFNRFKNWYLAIAGYNFSPRKIEYRLQRYKVEEFWDLPRLPRQTRNYVPTFIAAAIIAKEPGEYGFFIEPESAIEFDTVTVNECVDLNIVATCVESDFDYLKKLNPALLRWCTPPDKESWLLNIPKGTREKFIDNYARVPDNRKLTWIHHRIRSGETLSTIARRYGVGVSEIKRFNKIRGTLIRAGRSLVIPVPQNKKYKARLAKASLNRNYAPKRKIVSNVPGRIVKVHTVVMGESLWEIAIKYQVTITQIRSWNGLGYSRIIRPGQKLNIWLPEDSPLLAGLADSPDDKITVDKNDESTPKQMKTVYHKVRRGDSLWKIANLYGVSIREIKKWNNLNGNMIKPGEQLRILIAE